MRRRYLVTFEGLSHASRKEVAETAKLAVAWWHHLGDTWILVDDEDFDFWHTLFFELCTRHNARFILAELPPGSRVNGRLPKKAWDWIRTMFG